MSLVYPEGPVAPVLAGRSKRVRPIYVISAFPVFDGTEAAHAHWTNVSNGKWPIKPCIPANERGLGSMETLASRIAAMHSKISKNDSLDEKLHRRSSYLLLVSWALSPDQGGGLLTTTVLSSPPPYRMSAT